jgi:hypothetical protein
VNHDAGSSRISSVLRCTAIVVSILALASSAVAGSGQRLVSAHGVRLSLPADWKRVRLAQPGQATDATTLIVRVGDRASRRQASEALAVARSFELAR